MKDLTQADVVNERIWNVCNMRESECFKSGMEMVGKRRSSKAIRFVFLISPTPKNQDADSQTRGGANRTNYLRLMQGLLSEQRRRTEKIPKLAS